MREHGTLATAIVVVLLSGVMTAAAMTGVFSRGDNSPAVLTLEMADGSQGDAAAGVGVAGATGSKGKKGSSAAHGTSPATGAGLSAEAGVTAPVAGSPTPIGEATAGSG
jgi:hypothetical protein